MRRYVAFFILVIAGAVAGCSLLGAPAGPGGSFDERQQKAYAAAILVSQGVFQDLKPRLRADEVADAAAGCRLVGQVLGGAVNTEQAETDLRNLIGSNVGMTKTIASIIYAANAYLPQEFKATVGLAMLRDVAGNCADVFGTDGGAA